jgi:hypothetical protein
VNGTGSGLYSIAGSGINGVETSGSATINLAVCKKKYRLLHFISFYSFSCVLLLL